MTGVQRVREGSGRRPAPLRLVQVGLGGFGLSWASEVIPSVTGVVLEGAVDPDPHALEKARTLTSLTQDRCFSSLHEALASTEPDAVLITASLHAHIPSALTALEAGKHVLVEKPFAPSLHDAQVAVAAAEAAGRVLMVSQNYRFFPAVRAVTSLLARGKYGTIDAVHVDFRRYDNDGAPDRHRHYRFPQPIVVDMAIHHFDLMRLVLGREPVEVYCSSWNPPWSRFEEPAEAMAVVRFEDDIMVSYRGSWLSGGAPTAWAGEWRMELSGGEVAWTSREGRPLESADSVFVTPLGRKRRQVRLPEVEYVDRAGSLHQFVRCVRTGDEPESSGRRNLKTLALTLTAVESAEVGRPLPVPRLGDNECPKQA